MLEIKFPQTTSDNSKIILYGRKNKFYKSMIFVLIIYVIHG